LEVTLEFLHFEVEKGSGWAGDNQEVAIQRYVVCAQQRNGFDRNVILLHQEGEFGVSTQLIAAVETMFSMTREETGFKWFGIGNSNEGGGKDALPCKGDEFTHKSGLLFIRHSFLLFQGILCQVVAI